MIAKLDNLLRESSLPSLTPDATWQPLEPGNNGVVCGMDVTVTGSGSDSSRVLSRPGLVVAGGRLQANLHAPGATIVLDGTRSARAPMITLNIYTTDFTIYLNLDDLEPVSSRPLHLQVTAYNGSNQFVYWGEGASSVQTHCVLDGDRRKIQVERDAMLSNGIFIRTHDGHALVDLANRLIINPGGDIRIGRHVWVGQEVLVLGPANIGDGSIVGAKSMAKGEIAPCTLVGGVPAKVLREQVSWSRVPGTLQFLEQELNGMSVAFDAGQPTASGCEQRSS